MKASAATHTQTGTIRGGRASTPPSRSGAVAAGVFSTALLALAVWTSTGWIGTTFPGFLLNANRMVSSIALPAWSETSGVAQQEVLAVDGVAVASAAQVYEHARGTSPGTTVHYTVRKAGGVTTTVPIATRRFARADSLLLFGTCLVNGIAFIAVALVVFWLRPRSATSFGLLSACLTLGVFAFTAVDLYGSQWLLRLHAAAAAFAPAGLLHFALVFPTDRIRRHRRSALAMIYLAAAALAGWYELQLDDPAVYGRVHLIAAAAFGLCATVALAASLYDLLTSKAALVRRRMGLVALGAVCGLLLPAALMAAAPVVGKTIGLHALALAGFLFPLSLGYAVVKRDLFAIDDMLRRALTYGVVVITITAIYLSVLLLFGVLVPGRQLWASSPIALAVLNLGLLFAMAPIRARAQAGIDRIFFSKGYEVEEALSMLSRLLASARTIEQVVAHTREVLGATVGPLDVGVLLREGDCRFRPAVPTSGDKDPVTCPIELVCRLESRGILARYELEDGSGRPCHPIWTRLGAQLLVAICMNDTAIALLTLAPKGSGRPYTAHDLAFLRTAANQIALAVSNAAAFKRMEELNKHLEQLNENLERQVRERTAAFHTTNGELNQSLERLQRAYAQLEQSQASLLRADRLATLGRLTAGLAHEMNTPLSAVLNSLKILGDLGNEYATSIGDPEVLADDHHEIATEIMSSARAAMEWAEKAAAFIRSVKGHGRETRSGGAQRFLVRDVVADTRGLVAHRLRAASCRIDFAEEAEGTSLVGDAGRFGQVMVNLVTNAIDAYEDRGVSDARIEIRATRAGNNVEVAVRDWAGGIPTTILPRIFDELFTTKGPGRGTGLGLWIARNLVEEGFGGTLDVLTTPGGGSCFTAIFPDMVSDDGESLPLPERQAPAAASEAVHV